jgi:hypothetical protein
MFKSLDTARPYPRKYLALGILSSLVYIASAIRMIVHHNDLGWFLLPCWALVFALWFRHASRQKAKG